MEPGDLTGSWGQERLPGEMSSNLQGGRAVSPPFPSPASGRSLENRCLLQRACGKKRQESTVARTLCVVVEGLCSGFHKEAGVCLVLR